MAFNADIQSQRHVMNCVAVGLGHADRAAWDGGEEVSNPSSMGKSTG